MHRHAVEHGGDAVQKDARPVGVHSHLPESEAGEKVVDRLIVGDDADLEDVDAGRLGLHRSAERDGERSRDTKDGFTVDRAQIDATVQQGVGVRGNEALRVGIQRVREVDLGRPQADIDGAVDACLATVLDDDRHIGTIEVRGHVRAHGAQRRHALQQRVHPAESRVRMPSEATPAWFIAFDILAEGDIDLRNRRRRLSSAPGTWSRAW